MAFKCVPEQVAVAILAGSSKHDGKAIYRRPNGDLTAGLPMRGHQRWVAKGLQYVTIADPESFNIVAPHLENPEQYICGRDGDGRKTPWNVALYLKDVASLQESADAELKALVEKYGVEMVESIKGVKVPDHLKPAPKETRSRAGAAA